MESNKSSNREYIVYDLSEIDTIDFRTVLETSRDTMRVSNNGFISKYIFQNNY